jgi:predicted NUDIX family NTP pyrophosphohydrolase
VRAPTGTAAGVLRINDRVPFVAEASAGILLYRLSGAEPEVLLVHPGGPFWAKKDDGAWSIPKGLQEPGEEPLAAARREFAEETGTLPSGEAIPLGSFRQASGKTVTAFALAGDLDLAGFRSNSFEIEWPPRSGRRQAFPEADRAGWFTLAEARVKLTRGQLPLLDALARVLGRERT